MWAGLEPPETGKRVGGSSGGSGAGLEVVEDEATTVEEEALAATSVIGAATTRSRWRRIGWGRGNGGGVRVWDLLDE